MQEGSGIVKYARELLLSDRVHAGIGIGVVQLSARRLAVRTVATQTAGAGRFRDFAAAVLQINRHRSNSTSSDKRVDRERPESDVNPESGLGDREGMATHAAIAELLVLVVSALVGWKSVAEYVGQICAAIYRYRHIPRQAHFFCWQHCSVNTPYQRPNIYQFLRNNFDELDLHHHLRNRGVLLCVSFSFYSPFSRAQKGGDSRARPRLLRGRRRDARLAIANQHRAEPKGGGMHLRLA